MGQGNDVRSAFGLQGGSSGANSTAAFSKRY
jgi:hypothetical protein